MYKRQSEENLAIAREVDAVADLLGKSSTQVAIAWVRQRGTNIVPIVGARTLAQVKDSLGSVDLVLSSEHLARLDEKSRIPLGFPRDFLGTDYVRKIVYSDVEDKIELPRAAQKPR